MKRLALAVTVAACLPVCARSQVQMYGIIDTAFAVGSRGAGSSSAIRVDTGGLNASRFGIRGREDLGGGFHAFFGIEAGFNSDDGTGQAASGALDFRRRAVVGLESTYGRIYFGRDVTPGLVAIYATDIFGLGMYGNTLSMLTGQIGANNPLMEARRNNAIYYTSPVGPNLQLRALYSLGESDTPPRSRGSEAAVAVLYDDKTVIANAYYFALKSASDPIVNTRRYGLGGGYNFGSWRIVGGHSVSDPEGSQNTGESFNLGVALRWGRGELMAQGLTMKQQTAEGLEPKSKTYGLAYQYPLTKRTDLYGFFGTVRNNPTGFYLLQWGALASVPVEPGANVRSLGIGIRHQF